MQSFAPLHHFPASCPVSHFMSTHFDVQVAVFPVEAYGDQDMNNAFTGIQAYQWPSGGATEIRVGLYNASSGVRGPFLETTYDRLRRMLDRTIEGAFAFSRHVIEAFKKNELNEKGKRGTLLFTGATSSIRGNVLTSAFAAGKSAVRSLSQSLNKEFGPQNIHVSASGGSVAGVIDCSDLFVCDLPGCSCTPCIFPSADESLLKIFMPLASTVDS